MPFGDFFGNQQQNPFAPLATAGGFGSTNFNPLSMPGRSFTADPAGKTGSLFDKLGSILGSEKFGTGLSAFGNLASIYSGFKSLGLAKDQFQFQKDAFNQNFAAQRKDYENTLKDRWTARSASAASRGNTFEGMDQWVASRNIAPGGV